MESNMLEMALKAALILADPTASAFSRSEWRWAW